MVDTRLEKMKQKRDVLNARIQQVEARARSKLRKQETRKKILLGSLLLEWMQKDEAIKLRAESELETWLTRKLDRELFGLGDRENEVETHQAEQAAG